MLLTTMSCSSRSPTSVNNIDIAQIALFRSFLFYGLRWSRRRCSFLFLPWCIWRWVWIIFFDRRFQFCLKAIWMLQGDTFNCAYIGRDFWWYFQINCWRSFIPYKLCHTFGKNSHWLKIISFLEVRSNFVRCYSVVLLRHMGPHIGRPLVMADFYALEFDCLCHRKQDFQLHSF